MAETATWPAPIERIESGVPGLDTVLRGGLIRRGVYLIHGAPGSGKTVLGNQIMFHHAAAGGRGVYVSLLAESPARLFSQLQGFSFLRQEPVGNELFYLSGFEALEEGGLNALLDLIRRQLTERQATLLVVDGLTNAHLALGSAVEFRRFVHYLQGMSIFGGCTTLLLSSDQADEGTAGQTMVDGIINVVYHQVGTRDVRELRIRKMRGSAFLGGPHELDIATNGIVIHPRLESVVGPPSSALEMDRSRLSFGVARLDDMLDGGVLGASSTVLMGTPGSGKTLLGMHFLAEGCRRGETGVYLGFAEPPAWLVAKAEQVGLRLAPAVDSGRLHVLWECDEARHLDVVAERLLREIDRSGARRLLLDGFEGLRDAAVHPDRVGRFLAALLGQLRRRGVTTLITVELQRLFGPEVDLPLNGVGGMAENLIFLRYVELRSQLHRLISVLKMRDSSYDTSIREFIIGRSGIEVADTFASAEAILTGVARPIAGAGGTGGGDGAS